MPILSRPFSLIVALLAGSLVFQSCGPSDQGEASDAATSVPPDPSRDAPAGVIPQPRLIDSTFTIRAASVGDEACELFLERQDGAVSARPAAHEVCLHDTEPKELVGEIVHLRVEKAPMLAPVCEDDPTCEEIAIVDLIVGLEPVPEILRD